MKLGVGYDDGRDSNRHLMGVKKLAKFGSVLTVESNEKRSKRATSITLKRPPLGRYLHQPLRRPYAGARAAKRQETLVENDAVVAHQHVGLPSRGDYTNPGY